MTLEEILIAQTSFFFFFFLFFFVMSCIQVPDVIEYNQMMQQAKQNSTVVKSPQRTASIRASSMPRLAVDQQVTKMNYSMFSYQLYILHTLKQLCTNAWFFFLSEQRGTDWFAAIQSYRRAPLVIWCVCDRGHQQTESWWSAPSPPSGTSVWTASGRSSTPWRESVLTTHTGLGGATEVYLRNLLKSNPQHLLPVSTTKLELICIHSVPFF